MDETTSTWRKTIRLLIAVASILFAIDVALFFYIHRSNVNQAASISDLKQTIEKIKKDQMSQDSSKSIADLQQLTLLLEHEAEDYHLSFLLLAISYDLSNKVVTDELIVQRAYFYKNGNAVIDIAPQPTFMSKLKGQGRFNLADRELKATLLNLIERIKEFYTESQKNNDELPSIDTFKIVLTQNNYDVGTYSNGSIKLKGE